MLREIAGQDSEPGPDLEHDVFGGELGEPTDDAEDFSSRGSAGRAASWGSRLTARTKAAVAFASIRALELGHVLATRGGERGDRVHDVCGLVRPAAKRLRREVRAVRLGEERSAGTCAAASRSSSALGYVTLPANEKYQPRSRPAPSRSGSEKQCRTTVPSKRASIVARVVVRLAGVDHDRQPELARERELGREEAPLLVLRRGAVVVVEARLAHGDRTLVAEELAQLVDAMRLVASRLVRVDPERGADAVIRRSELERGPARSDPGADRDHATHPGLARPRESAVGSSSASRCACVSITPRVAARCIALQLVGDDLLGIELRVERPRLAQLLPGRSSLGSQRPAHARSRR